MKLYFASTEHSYYTIHLKDIGVKNVLQSYYYLDFKKVPNELGFPDFLLDSGGYTLRKYRKTIPVSQYIDYLNKFNIRIAFNLDTADVEETLENHKIIVENTDCQIIPIYHYSDFQDPKTRPM